MKNKLKIILLIVSVLPYYAVIITGAVVRFTAVGLFSEYSFSAFRLGASYGLLLLTKFVPAIPLCFGYQSYLLISFLLNKFGAGKRSSAIISAVISVIIAAAVMIFFLRLFDGVELSV